MKRVRRCLECGIDISNRGNRSYLCREHQIEKTARKKKEYNERERFKSKSKDANTLTRGIWKTFTHKDSNVEDIRLEISTLKAELDTLSNRKNDGDYINSLMEKYNIKLQDYDYSNTQNETKRKYLKTKLALRTGIVVSTDAYHQVIQNRKDSIFTPPHRELELTSMCIDDVWDEMFVLRKEIDGIKYSIVDLYKEMRVENPNLTKREFSLTNEFAEKYEVLQSLERKMKMISEVWNWKNRMVKHTI